MLHIYRKQTISLKGLNASTKLLVVDFKQVPWMFVTRVVSGQVSNCSTQEHIFLIFLIWIWVPSLPWSCLFPLSNITVSTGTTALSEHLPCLILVFALMSLTVRNLGNFPLYHWNFTNYVLVKIQLRRSGFAGHLSPLETHFLTFWHFDTKYLVLGGVVAFNIQNTLA